MAAVHTSRCTSAGLAVNHLTMSRAAHESHPTIYCIYQDVTCQLKLAGECMAGWRAEGYMNAGIQ